jgi:hypothetical protein
MDEAKIERLERTLWELEQLASELFDMGYITQGNMIYDAVEAMDMELQDVVEGRA